MSWVERLHRKLLKWSENPDDLLLGDGLNEEGTKDPVFVELLQSAEENERLRELLQILCTSFRLVSDRMLGDHLEGGIYDEMSSASLDSETVSLPKTNVCSERDFALLDR